MGIRSEGNGHGDVWKILIGLSVACAVLVFLGGFLHRRALDSAVAERQARSVAFVNTKLADAAKQADLSKPLKDPEAAHLTKQLDMPAGTDIRLFSTAGLALYGSPGLEPFPADAEGIQAAAAGDQAHVVDGSDIRIYVPIDGKGAKPIAVAAVVSNYTQLREDASGPLDGVRLPIVGLGVVLLVAGLLLMVQSTKGGASAKASTRNAKQPAAPKAKASTGGRGRVTGFDPVPVTTAPAIQRIETDEPEIPPEPVADAPAAEGDATPEPTRTLFGLRLGSKKPKEAAAAAGEEPVAVPAKPKRSLFGRTESAAEPATVVVAPAGNDTSALDREVAIRLALEDQLEQLRTRIQMQDVEAANAQKELRAQIEAANRRAEEAEARASDAGAAAPQAAPAAPQAAPAAPQAAPAAPVPDEGALRVQQLEREVAEARSVTADAVARAETLQRQLDEALAPPAAAPPPADPSAAAKVDEAMAQLADAQQRASAAEQRAASIESVRDELEVRVAQLGTKATELEQRATELETSLNEATASGDAVRVEIATLTAALAAANARVTELESAPPVAAGPNEQGQAEIARLRSELANHMERAQAAEERARTLEADILAAERGVSSLPAEAPEEPSMSGGRSLRAAAGPTEEPHSVSRFETSESEETTLDPAPIVAEETASEPEDREAEADEDQMHIVSEPATKLKRVVEGGEASDAAQAASDPEPSREDRAPAPVNRWGSFAEASLGDDVGSSSEPTAPATTDESSMAPIETAASTAEPAEAEIHGSAQAETHEPKPVEAKVHAPVESTPAVEWHAPAPTAPAPTAAPDAAASPNGNGMPPAPSDAARYDDIWTAAFAPPEARSEPTSVAEPAPDAAAEPDAAVKAGPDAVVESEQAPPDQVGRTPETRQGAVPPDDQPSPPEDRLSAEDDMWSLRARLADAASRKKMPHQID